MDEEMVLLKKLPALLHLAARARALWMRLEFQVNIRSGHFLRERNYGISDFLTDRAPITSISLASCVSPRLFLARITIRATTWPATGRRGADVARRSLVSVSRINIRRICDRIIHFSPLANETPFHENCVIIIGGMAKPKGANVGFR